MAQHLHGEQAVGAEAEDGRGISPASSRLRFTQRFTVAISETIAATR
jgi:hypothetical protein